MKVRHYTIGISTANQRPEASLDERNMQHFEHTGDSYARTSNIEDLRRIYDRGADLEASRFGRQRLRWYNELANHILLPGAGLLLVGIAPGATLFRTAP